MPRITIKTNTYVQDMDKARIIAEVNKAIELIPCEKDTFCMTDFVDEAFMLFGETPAAPCASVDIESIDEVYAQYDRKVFVQVQAQIIDVIMRYTGIPEDRIYAYYRRSPLWVYKKQDIVGTLLHF